MRKQTAGGKSTTRWRLSFWRFSIGFRIITVLFHKKQSVRQDGLFFYKKGDLNSRGHLERSRRKSACCLSYCTLSQVIAPNRFLKKDFSQVKQKKKMR